MSLKSCKRFADTVHAVHYPTVTGKNDRERQIAIEDQAGMLDDLATGGLVNRLIRPIGFIKLTNRR
jgi:hypothetical protein